MGLFRRLFRILQHNKGNGALLDEYDTLNAIARELSALLQALRDEQVTLQANLSRKATPFGMAVHKTEDIETALIPKLRMLEALAEEKFLEVTDSKAPLDPVQEKEVRLAIAFLQEIKIFLPELDRLEHMKDDIARLELISSALRTTVKLCEAAYELEQQQEAVAYEATEKSVGSLIEEIYDHCFIDEISKVLVYPLTPQKLGELEQQVSLFETQREYWHKKGFTVKFRNMWLDEHRPEVDTTTRLKKPHVNITIGTPNGPKKNIHLLVA